MCRRVCPRGGKMRMRVSLAEPGPGDTPAGVPVHPRRSSAFSSVFVVQDSSAYVALRSCPAKLWL